jgi:hypothetical protein
MIFLAISCSNDNSNSSGVLTVQIKTRATYLNSAGRNTTITTKTTTTSDNVIINCFKVDQF